MEDGGWKKKLPRAAGVCTLVGMHHVVRCATRLVACDCIKVQPSCNNKGKTLARSDVNRRYFAGHCVID